MLDCRWLFDVQTLHQPCELLPGKGLYFGRFSRPSKTSGFQSLVQKNKSVTFPKKDLDPVTLSAAKEKDTPRERIQMELALHHRCQSVNGFSHICPAADNVDVLGNTDISYHACFTARRRVAIVFSGVPSGISIAMPSICIVMLEEVISCC